MLGKILVCVGPMAHLLTCTDEVGYLPFLPLEHVPSFATADVEGIGVTGSAGEEGTDQDTLHPVVEVTHQLDRALLGE